MHRPRPRTIAIGALVVLLGAAPFIPRGGGDHGAISPSGDQPRYAPRVSTAVGYTKVTPAMQKEINRVVDATASLPQQHGRISARSATALTQCADLDGQRYCLGQGWTDESATTVQARVATEVAPPAGRRAATKHKATYNTGDLSAKAQLKRLAAMTPKQRAKAERTELTAAARSVAKVWMIRHEIQGAPLPADFLAQHPEARVIAAGTAAVAGRADTGAIADAAAVVPLATGSQLPTVLPVGSATGTTGATGTTNGTTTGAVAASTPAAPVATAPVAPAVPVAPAAYPVKSKILKKTQTAEQVRTYWCGPTSMQMIAWGWKQKDKGAAHWATKLHTTSGGTAISDMVRVTNANTGWDTKAGPYITLDVKSFSTAQFWALLQKHIAQYQAPIILHPQLQTRFFPYLDHNGSGHFQVGRGYKTTVHTHTQEIGYFEPWNQQRFHPSEPYISRVQWLPVDRMLGAVKANAFHNIGV